MTSELRGIAETVVERQVLDTDLGAGSAPRLSSVEQTASRKPAVVERSALGLEDTLAPIYSGIRMTFELPSGVDPDFVIEDVLDGVADASTALRAAGAKPPQTAVVERGAMFEFVIGISDGVAMSRKEIINAYASAIDARLAQWRVVDLVQRRRVQHSAVNRAGFRPTSYCLSRSSSTKSLP